MSDGVGRESIAHIDLTRRSKFTRISAPSAAVPFRLVLSGSGRTLAIVPLTRLSEGVEYAVAVSGLADAVGGAIIAPPTTFTTQSNTAPQYDTDQLVFSFPNASKARSR